MSSSYRIALENWLSDLEVKADRVLDIGGSQNPLPKRVHKWEVGEYLIADLPQPHVDSPKPDVELDLNLSVPQAVDLIEDIDLIFCLEVFEYIWDPHQAFIIINKMLKDGGIAWVTFPSFYPIHQPIEDDSLRYMEGGIRKLAATVGLTVEEVIYRRPESQFLNAFWSAERMRAAKGVDHNFTGYIVRFSK